LCMTNHPEKSFCVWPMTQASLVFVYDKSHRQVFLCMTNHPDKSFCVWQITQASLFCVWQNTPGKFYFGVW
jgi:hypothetical protein